MDPYREIFERPMFFGLDGSPIGMDEAGALLGDAQRRRVAETMIATDAGMIHVSTVFLVLDHSLTGDPPELWETMAFGDVDIAEEARRYATREAAAAGHGDVVALVRTALDVAGRTVVGVVTAQ